MTLWLSALTFLLSLATVRLFLAWFAKQLLDLPGARSSHSRPTPTGAGAAGVAAWFLVASLGIHLGAVSTGPLWNATALCAGALAALGLLDDIFSLPRSARYLVHLLIALAALHWVGYPQPSWLPVWLGWLGCVVFLTALINTFNFMDGMDALVAASGTMVLGFLAWFTAEPLWALLAAAYAGVLVFNLPPARVFMGDAGSTVLGGSVGIAFLAGRGTLEPRHLILLGPIVGDATYTILRRALRGDNILVAHHSHLYQRLFRAGHSHARISAGYAAGTATCGLLVVFAGNWGGIAALVGCAMLVLATEIHLGRKGVPFARPTSAASRVPG